MVLLQTIVVLAAIWFFDPKIGIPNTVLPLFVYGVYLFVVFQGELCNDMFFVSELSRFLTPFFLSIQC